ncbi:MAG: hypothetical protein A49_11660 [Methyloceanibacter sp.]|nr:MAG: hypothetical protein A49_11660 [Methyloceanibacter sp.]
MRYLVQLCLVVGALTGDPTLVRSKPDDTVSVATQIEILRQHDRHLEDSTKSQFDLIKWAIGLFGGLFGAFVGLGTFLFERRYRHDRAELLRESKVHIEATIAAAEKKHYRYRSRNAQLQIGRADCESLCAALQARS